MLCVCVLPSLIIKTFIKLILYLNCRLIPSSVGTKVILPPWSLNSYCYEMVDFDNILERIKNLGKNFINKNKNDYLIEPLIREAKPSMSGHHSPVFKILNW